MNMSEPQARLPIDALSGSSGFRADTRFGSAQAEAGHAPVHASGTVLEDPVASAYAEGFAAGTAEARAKAEEEARDLADAQDRLALSFARLDKDMEEELRQRLRETVFALCETAIAPLALDEAALVRRVKLAVSMLARADDERVIRLHPDDIALVTPSLAQDWTIAPDSRTGTRQPARRIRNRRCRRRPGDMAARDCRSAAPMLKLFQPILADLATEPISLAPRRYGLVSACDGGLLEVSGLAVPVGSMCRVAHGRNLALSAEVIGFRNGRTMMMMLGDSVMLRPGARVWPEGHPGLLPVGEAFLGRAVDGEGLPIDGGNPIHARSEWPAQGMRSAALDRSPVREPFDTGVRAINALTTFGIGQRIGIMAGSGVGKSVLIDMIARGSHADIVVVGLIGERAREVSDFVERHMSEGKRERTAVVAVPADHAPNLRLRGAMLATSLAEKFRAAGKRVLLIMDSLTRVAHAAREIGLLLGEPGAARGYPPSALATITRLVERAGNSAASGGSITGIYTVLADGDNQDDPVVDTARSILDGHIVLSRELAQRGQYPAVDIAASLSRVMNDITGAEHQSLARMFRALSASYEANRDLVLMGAYRAGADPQLDRAIAMHEALSAFLGQDAHDTICLDDSVAQLSALLGDEAA